MRKIDKIKEAKRLITSANSVSILTDEEQAFLISRFGVHNLDFKQPLLILADEDKETEQKIRLIADKLHIPVIKIMRKVVECPETEPGTVTRGESKPDDRPRIRRANKPAVKKVEEPKEVKEPEEVQEDEPVIKPGVKYRLSFPNVWDIDDDDDMRIRTYFR